MAPQRPIFNRPDVAEGRSPVGMAERPRELEDALNYHLYHPLAARIARGLASTPITPNMVSIVSGLCVVGAAIAYVQPGWPLTALLGLLLHMAWHVFDGADGDLARLTGRSSAFGEIVDGVCDYASHIILYVVLAIFLQSQIGPIAWLLAAISGASHIVQSNHFEVQRRQYLWWVYGVPWLRSMNDKSVGKSEAGEGRLAAFGAVYLWLASRLTAGAGPIDGAVENAGHDQRRLDQIRLVVRQEYLPLLPRLFILSSNHRTVVLGLSMLAGSPSYYFVYQAVVLNIVLVRSIGRFNLAMKRIDVQLHQMLPNTLR